MPEHTDSCMREVFINKPLQIFHNSISVLKFFSKCFEILRLSTVMMIEGKYHSIIREYGEYFGRHPYEEEEAKRG